MGTLTLHQNIMSSYYFFVHNSLQNNWSSCGAITYHAAMELE